MTTIGARIRIARKRLPNKATQKDIADHFGISVQAVSAWERGETKDLSRERIEKLAVFLQVSRDWLEGKTDEIPPLKDDLVSQFQTLTSDQQIMIRGALDALARENSKRAAKRAKPGRIT